LFVALVPLTISALTTLNIHQKAFDDQISEIHLMSARNGTAVVGGYFDNATRTLTLASKSIRWPELSDDERDGALWLVYRQLEDIAAASLLDHKGDGIGTTTYVDESSVVKEVAGHPHASLVVLKEFARHLPFEEAKKSKDTMAVGEVFMAAGSSTPFIPLAISVPGGESGRRWIVAFALSLRAVCGQIDRMSSEQGRVFLIDSKDRMVCPPSLAPVDPGLSSRDYDRQLEFRDTAGREMLAALRRPRPFRPAAVCAIRLFSGSC
jgi:hypothetical protein